MASSTPHGRVRDCARVWTRALLDEVEAIEQLMRAFPSPHADPGCPVSVETDTYPFGLMLRCVVRGPAHHSIESRWVSARRFVADGGLGGLLHGMYQAMDRRRHSAEFCKAVRDYTRDRTVTERVLPFEQLTLLEMTNLTTALETAWDEMIRVSMFASRWPRLCAAVAGLDARLSLHLESGFKCAVTVRRSDTRTQTSSMRFDEIGITRRWWQHVGGLVGLDEYAVKHDPAMRAAVDWNEHRWYTPVGTFLVASTAQRTRRLRRPWLPRELVLYVMVELFDLGKFIKE